MMILMDNNNNTAGAAQMNNNEAVAHHLLAANYSAAERAALAELEAAVESGDVDRERAAHAQMHHVDAVQYRRAGDTERADHAEAMVARAVAK